MVYIEKENGTNKVDREDGKAENVCVCVRRSRREVVQMNAYIDKFRGEKYLTTFHMYV